MPQQAKGLAQNLGCGDNRGNQGDAANGQWRLMFRRKIGQPFHDAGHMIVVRVLPAHAFDDAGGFVPFDFW